MSLFGLKSKIHLACITGANLNYEGSLEIDIELMDAAGINEYEQLHVYNNTNGNRYITYAIKGPAGSRVVSAHGAGAHLVSTNDRVIICTYQMMDPATLSSDYHPNVIRLNEQNIIQS
jgi:aspartate 1-decarboxylase